MARDNMTLEEVIQFTKQALENVNTDKRVSTEFRFAAWQVKRLLVWLEDYKRLKDEMIPAYDEQLTEAQCKVVQQMREMKQLKSDYIDLDHRLRTANTEIDRLQSVSSLIPCSERLPEKDGNYLCISNNEYKILPYRNGEFYCICFDAVLRCCNSSVTHWMPLPEPPQRKDDTHDYD